MRRLHLLVWLAVLYTACDSGAPGVDTSPEPELSGIVVALPSGAIEVAPDALTRVELSETFSVPSGESASFQIASVRGPVRATVTPDTTVYLPSLGESVQVSAMLVIEPTGAGTAEVVVEASLSRQRRGDATFRLVVPEPAPILALRQDLAADLTHEVGIADGLPAGIDPLTDVRLDAVEGPATIELSPAGAILIAPQPVAQETDVTARLVTTRYVPRTIEATFRLIPPQCPEAPPGTDDYFPLAVGDIWTFDLDYALRYSIPTSGRRYRLSGVGI